MNETLVDDVRAALHEKVDCLGKAAVARTLHRDYHPRRLSASVGASGVVLACLLVVGAAMLLMSPFNRPASAFAAWTPSPSRPAPGELEGARLACGVRRPTLEDVRGAFTALVYGQHAGVGICVTGPSVFFSGSASREPGWDPSAEGVSTVSVGSRDASGRAMMVLAGRVGSRVRAIRVERPKGMSVQATVSHGWFLAWWPSAERAARLRITLQGGSIRIRRVRGGGQAPSCPPGDGCASIGPAS